MTGVYLPPQRPGAAEFLALCGLSPPFRRPTILVELAASVAAFGGAVLVLWGL